FLLRVLLVRVQGHVGPRIPRVLTRPRHARPVVVRPTIPREQATLRAPQEAGVSDAGTARRAAGEGAGVTALQSAKKYAFCNTTRDTRRSVPTRPHPRKSL